MESKVNDESTYMKKRLEEQIAWYDMKSIGTQKKYKILKTITIISSALIPVVSLINFSFIDLKLIVSSLGALIVILESVMALNKYNDDWIRYRSICETLKSEKYMYMNKAGIYSEKDDNFQYFVERIETIISQENINWASLDREVKKKG